MNGLDTLWPFDGCVKTALDSQRIEFLPRSATDLLPIQRLTV